MKMKRKSRRRRERMEEMALVRASTKFLRLDQYLRGLIDTGLPSFQWAYQTYCFGAKKHLNGKK